MIFQHKATRTTRARCALRRSPAEQAVLRAKADALDEYADECASRNALVPDEAAHDICRSFIRGLRKRAVALRAEANRTGS